MSEQASAQIAEPREALTASTSLSNVIRLPEEESRMKAAAEDSVEFGKKRNNRISLFFIGADGVGKTTLKRRLLGEDIDLEEPSTVGIEVDVVEVEETNKGKPWKRTQDQQRMVSNEHYNEVIGKEAAKRIKEPSVEEKPQRSISDKRIEDPECSNAAETTSDGETTDITNVELQQKIKKYLTDAITRGAAKETEDVPPAKNIMVRRRERKIFEKVTLSPELKEAIRENMAKVEQYDDDELDKIRLLLQDVAGQSLFYDVHAMFLNIRALYILAVSLDKDLHDKAESLFVDRKSKKKIPIENYLVESNLDYVNKWMGALDNVSQGSTPRWKLPHVPPATFLVFTKSDTIPGNEKERESKIQEAIDTVLNSFTDHDFRRHIVGTFVIDNTNPEDPELLRLREEIFKTSRKGAMSQEKISINWLRLECGLATLMNETPYISFEALAQWLKVSGRDATQDMVEALKFLHQQSVIIYFHEEDQARNLVVLDPQWLVDLFTRIINIPSTQERSPENAGLWKRFEDRGELSSELLHLLLGEHENHLQALTSIMERVGLICRWNEKTWLVPSMARPKKETKEAIGRLQSCNISALWVDFGEGLVALGLFTRLQVYFLGLSSILGGKCPRLYCDFSCIHLTEDNVKYFIVLVQYASRIQVTFGGDDGLIPHDKLPVVASKVMFFLRKALEEFRDSSPVYEAINIRFAIKCDCNQPENTKCRRHQKEGCSSEDCQHLIPLEALKGDGFYCENTMKWYDGKKGSLWLGLKDLNTIYGLPPAVYKSVCSMLKVSSVGKDFRALAALLGYPRSRVEWLSSHLFDVILVHWATQEGHDLDTFIEILKKAGRNDVVEFLAKQGERTKLKEYLGEENRETIRKKRVENNTPPPGIQLIEMKDINPTKIAWSEATRDPTDVLLVAVNDIEFRAAYQILSEPKLADSYKDLGNVYFGQIKMNKVALVKSSMGADGSTGMIVTCLEAAIVLDPKSIINVGVCFGMNRSKQKLGDLVVSTRLACYDPNRVNCDGSTEFRGTILECKERITRLFEDGKMGWKSPGQGDVNVFCGLVISGSKLVDCKDFKQKLQQQFPSAIGGEMEGAGLRCICEKFRCPWMVCKAICDWGDGTKNKEWQPFAAVVAASYVKHVLTKNHVPGAGRE